MAELSDCKRMQMDHHGKCQNFVVKVEEIYFILTHIIGVTMHRIVVSFVFDITGCENGCSELILGFFSKKCG